MRPQPLIAVRDIEASSRWYQSLLKCERGHGGAEYERLMLDGELVMQLHHWDAHEHPYMGDPTAKPYGNGVLLRFEVEDFDACVTRARDLKAKILEEPHDNPSANHRECWIRDPDGYVVVVSSPYGFV